MARGRQSRAASSPAGGAQPGPVAGKRPAWGPGSAPLYRTTAALALLGFASASYLTYLYFSKAGAACPVGSGCDTVRASPYSSLLYVPVSVFGMAGFAAIAAIALLPLNTGPRRLALFLLATAGFAFAMYLTYREAFTIRAWCPYCLVAAATMTLVMLLVVLQRPPVPGVRAPALALLGLVVAGVVVIGAGTLPRGSAAAPASAPGAQPTEMARLAQHLASVGAVMYGTYTCPHCADQKRLFGEAFKYVKYIECSTGGPDPQPQRCASAGIVQVPTWTIKGQRYVGYQTAAQ